jgi:flavin reductase (DIM6/NTAB) family NADH-FMN oxidoreductase RutF
MSSKATPKLDAESHIRRNPHPDFKKVEASRPEWTPSSYKFTKTKDPGWKYGQGGNDGGASLEEDHVEIDPYEKGRPPTFNYKLLISAIVPRPIGFCSTVSEDGKSQNLAPFSYFNVINHDPPLFVFGFAGGFADAKDSLANLAATRECTVNIISEHFLEAANACSIDAPYGTSEWALSGLHPAPAARVRPPRVKEAVFSVECVLESTREFESRATPGKQTGVLAVVEGVRFWVRSDAINKERNLVDPAVLRPMSRLGGISYGRLTEGVEILRPVFEKERKEGKLDGLVKGKVGDVDGRL